MPPAEFEQLSLFEVFPGQKVLIGAFDQKAQRFGSCIMKWGYTRGNGMVINARSETFLYSPFAGSITRKFTPLSNNLSSN